MLNDNCIWWIEQSTETLRYLIKFHSWTLEYLEEKKNSSCRKNINIAWIVGLALKLEPLTLDFFYKHAISFLHLCDYKILIRIVLGVVFILNWQKRR